MKQLQQSIRTGCVSVAEVPVPRGGPGRVLVQVAASLISAGTERTLMDFGSKNLLAKARARPDLVRQILDKAQREGLQTTFQALRSRMDQPMALGYSCAGTVIEVGEDVDEVRVGDRVACAGGGYAVHAEIVSVPHKLVVRLPAAAIDASDETLQRGSAPGGTSDGETPAGGIAPAHGESVLGTTFEQAAFTTLGAIALQGLRLADVKLGETVAVLGLGVVGQLTFQMLKAAGCTVVGMDVRPERARLAREGGADAVATDAEGLVSAVHQASSGRGADAVLITADTPSNQPVELAGQIARDRGVVVAVGAVGTEVPRKIYYDKELAFRISRSYGPGRYDPEYEEHGRDYPIGYVRWTEQRNMQAFAHLLATRKVVVQPLISHRFPLAAAPAAYDLIGGKTGEPFLGVLLTYPERHDTARTVQLSPRVFTAAEPRPLPAPLAAIGLLGAGNFATTTLLPAMKKVAGIELVGVATATGLSGRHAAERFGFRYCTTDERQLLDDPAINTVVVATRHDLHGRQVVSAINAGKSVHCEKPLCLNERELREIVAAVHGQPPFPGPAAPQGQPPFPGTAAPRGQAAGRVTVGYNRRFAPLAGHLKASFSGAREPLVLHYRVNAGYIAPDHWVHDRAQGGGRILGEVCHFVDFVSFLVGAAPTRVHARALPDQGRYRTDNVVITLDFPDGSLGTITYVANGDRACPKERLEVFGGGAVAVLEDFRRLELMRSGRRQTHTARWQQDKGHRGEWEAFVRAVQTGGPAPITLPEIVATSVATFRILDALREGEPVPVNTDDFLSP